jgi:hypothetical protein
MGASWRGPYVGSEPGQQDAGVVSHVEDTRWGRELIGGREKSFGDGEEAEAPFLFPRK